MAFLLIRHASDVFKQRVIKRIHQVRFDNLLNLKLNARQSDCRRLRSNESFLERPAMQQLTCAFSPLLFHGLFKLSSLAHQVMRCAIFLQLLNKVIELIQRKLRFWICADYSYLNGQETSDDIEKDKRI